MPSSILKPQFEAGDLSDAPVYQEELITPKPKKAAIQIATKWLEDFNEAIKSKDSAAAASLFREDGVVLHY
jgi:hypothetical protein